MKRLGLLGVLLVALLSISLLQPSQHTLAQDIWCYRFDFTADDGGWAVETEDGFGHGTYDTGNGWRHTDAVNTVSNPDGAYRMVYISKASGSTVVTRIDMTYDYTKGTFDFNTYPAVQILLNGITAESSAFTAMVDGEDQVLQWIGSESEIDEVSLWLRASRDTSSPYNYSGAALITEVYLEGEGENPFGENPPECDDSEVGDGLTRPLANIDEHPDWGIYDLDYISTLNPSYGSDYLVNAYSTLAGANVAAVADGTVISVTPFTPTDCLNGVVLGSLFLCAAVVQGPLTETSFNLIYALEMVGNYTVVVEDSTDPNTLYSYVLAAPTVTVGDEVAAGCVIGKTIQLKQMPFPDFEAGILGIGISGGLSFVSQPTSAGVAYVTMFEEAGEGITPVPLYPRLVLQPDLADCKEERLEACINSNPDLDSLDYYIADSDVSMLETGDGVNIPRFQYIIQNNIMIDPEETYTLSVQARARTAGGIDDFVTMNLQITSLVGEFSVTTDWRNYTLETTGEDWYQGTVASVAVSNQQSSAADLEVRYICLSPITASTAPGSCYFANHEFDQDGTGWTFSATTFNFGQAIMRHEDTLGQMVLLKPDDESTPHTYTIRAVARLLASSLYTGQVGKEVTLNYEYPPTTGVEEVGTIDSAAVLADGLNTVTGAVALDYAYVLETTIEIEEDIQDTFTFSVEVTDGDGYLQGLRLDSVCIDPEGDGSFPGQGDDGGYVPPFVPGCSVVPVPIEGSVGAWTFYHWAQLNRFFKCTLMTMLNNWFKLFDSFRRTMLGVARYWIALVHHVSRWVGSVFMWLDGSFRNIATGQVVSITDSGGCHDFFCAIVDVVTTMANFFTPMVAALERIVDVLLGVLVGTVNLFFSLIGGLVAIAVAFIVKLLSFFQLAGNLLATLVGAYNSATPTAIPGLPMCGIDPESSIGLCTMIWATDNTIFAGRWGVLFAVLLSIFAVHLILWAIGEFKDVLLKTWGSS